MSRLNVVVGTDTGPLATGLAKGRKMVGSWGKGIQGRLAGAFAFTGVASFMKGLMDQAENLSDAADRYATTTEFLQQATNVADVTGSKFGDVEITLKALTRRSQLAIMSNNEYRKSFDSLGISIDQLRNSSPEELFMLVADATAAATDRSTAFKDVVNVAGDSAKNLFTMFQMGSQQIRETGDEMGVWGEEATRNLANANVSLREFGMLIKTNVVIGLDFALKMVQTLMAALIALGMTAVEAFKLAGSYIGNFMEMQVQLIKNTAALGRALKAALTGNFKDATDELKEYMNAHEQALTDMNEKNKKAVDNFKQNEAGIRGGFDEYFEEDIMNRNADGSQKKGSSSQDFETAAAMSKLQEEIATKAEELRQASLSSEAKLAELTKQRQQLEEIAKLDTIEGLEARKQILDIEKETLELNKKINTEAEQKTKMLEAEMDKMEQLRSQAEQAESGLKFSRLDDEEKLIKLYEKQKELLEEANDTTEEGLKARKELAGVNGQIDKLEEENSPANRFDAVTDELRNRLSVDADALARVGGGGYVQQTVPFTEQLIAEQRKLLTVMEGVEKNTRTGGIHDQTDLTMKAS